MTATGRRGDGLSAVKLAVLAQQVRSETADADLLEADPVAIVGMACRFPGATDSPEQLWELLRSGGDAIVEVPPDRWPAADLYDPDRHVPGKMNTRWGGFLSGIDQFDAAYFGLSPREAARMDPQQRLLLEVAVEALERAGRPVGDLAGTPTGVFVAATMADYNDRQYGDLADVDAYALTGNLHCILANRLSFLFDLRGPSVAVDTACSSSLVAVHMACQSIRSRESDLAVVGAVNVVLSPEPTVAMTKWGVMASDGRCKTFDAAADGFVRSEGCGVVVLERLSDAIAAGDPVLAVIRGSAVNQDGRSSAMSAPNGLAQQDVVRRALARARVPASQIGCIEAHGTGTALGDPIEVESLGAVFGAGDGDRPVVLTAVKPNLGHLEAAAGMAGLIKVVLCLEHEEIPPVLHFRTLNPHISLEGTRLVVPTEPYPWPAGADRRYAGVSSFGFGGTNAHVIVEEPPTLPLAAPVDGPVAIPLSARTPTALGQAAARLADHLDGRADVDLAAVAYTAAVRRNHHEDRLVVVGGSRADVVDRLRLFAGGRRAGLATGRADTNARHKVAFVCSGQGSQWWGMARGLMASSAPFREVVERCDVLLGRHVDWSLVDQLRVPEEESRLDETSYAQPAIFAVQVALAEVWRRWGVEPDVVIGHSVGEVAAAHLSGVLTLEDAVRLVVHRSAVMEPARGRGMMASVRRAEDDLAAELTRSGGRVSVAAVNAPNATVVSGDVEAVAALLEAVRADGADAQELRVAYAFHSDQMAGAAAELESALADLAPRPTDVRFLSTVTGRPAEGTDLDAHYWARNVRETVRFAAAVESAAALGCDAFVELGPHPVLGGAMVDTLERLGGATVVASLRRGRPDAESMLQAVGELHCAGVPVDWAAVSPGRRPVEALPTYPWQHERHWHDAGARVGVRQQPARPAAGFAGRQIRSRAISGRLFETELDATGFLADHRVGAAAVLPATAYVELAAASFAAATGRPATSVRDLQLEAALRIGDATVVQTHLEQDGPETAFTICSEDGDGWVEHARGTVTSETGMPGAPRIDPAVIRARCPQERTGAEIYAGFSARGLDFRTSFRAVDTVWVGDDEALAHVRVPAVVDGAGGSAFVFHPAVLDAAFHAVQALLAQGTDLFLPIAIAGIELAGSPDAEMWSHVQVRDRKDRSVVVDVGVHARDGAPLATVSGMRLVPTTLDAVAALTGGRPSAGERLLHTLAWRPSAIAVPASEPGPCLVIADRGGVGAAVARRLGDAGRSGLVIGPDEELTADAIAELVAARGVEHVVYLRGLDAPPLTETSDVVAEQARSLGGALVVAQAMLTAPACLWLVTRGAYAVGGSEAAPEQATVAGVGASVGAEHPDVPCRRLDLDPSGPTGGAAADVVSMLCAPGDEELTAIRAGARFGARLVPLPAAGARPRRDPVRLASTQPGVLERLELVPFQRRTPGPGEVEIRVAATGLNFRDVLIALDLYPEKLDAFGQECSGEIVRVGPDVEHLAAGDRVMALGSGAFATHLTTPASLVAPVPDAVDLTTAATLPVAFLTAQMALEDLAALRPGERVLIHAGAGGVGMAAIQVARRLGAEVLATAGSPEKRARLRALGVEHVFDSRSLDFVAGVTAATGGAGVDVVLNSLSGNFIPRSLDVLASGGRFVEIGRRDVWSHEQVAAARPDVRYDILFLGDLLDSDHPRVQAMLAELTARLAGGELAPLPVTSFDSHDVVEAFRFMAQARHVGKVVVRHPLDGPVRRGTYLVTGGLGGVGLELARHLAEGGIRHLALVGRNDPTPAATTAVDELRQNGVEVRVLRADVSVRADVAAALAEVAATMPPLGGIVHAAGVTDDAPLAAQTWGHFERVLEPKAAGAWHLYDLTRDLPLDELVLVSSVASVVGSPGQSNYAAANAFLDALAGRARFGTGAVRTIGFGPWDGIGMTARLASVDRARMERRGLRSLPPTEARAAFDGASAVGVPYVVAADLDGARLEHRPLLAELRTDTAVTAEAGDLFDRWVATVPGLRRTAITTFVADQARTILGLPAATEIPGRRPFQELGLDSLMAVELRNAVGAAVGRPQPPTLLFDHPTPDALVERLLAEVVAASPPPGPTAPDAGSQVDEDLAELTEAEAEALLLAELGDTRGVR